MWVWERVPAIRRAPAHPGRSAWHVRLPAALIRRTAPPRRHPLLPLSFRSGSYASAKASGSPARARAKKYIAPCQPFECLDRTSSNPRCRVRRSGREARETARRRPARGCGNAGAKPGSSPRVRLRTRHGSLRLPQRASGILPGHRADQAGGADRRGRQHSQQLLRGPGLQLEQRLQFSPAVVGTDGVGTLRRISWRRGSQDRGRGREDLRAEKRAA